MTMRKFVKKERPMRQQQLLRLNNTQSSMNMPAAVIAIHSTHRFEKIKKPKVESCFAGHFYDL